MGHFAESVSDSCVLHCVPGHSFPLGSGSAHLFQFSELCQLLHNLLFGWEEGDLLGDTSHSKFLDLDSNLVNPVQKHVLCQGQGGREEERCCALTELWSWCVDVGGGIAFRVLRSASSHSSEWLILMFQRKWRTEPSFTQLLMVQSGLFVDGIKDCIFHHRAVELLPCNALLVQDRGVLSFKFLPCKLKYRVFISPVSPWYPVKSNEFQAISLIS